MPFSGVQTCALDRKSTRLNSSHTIISYAVFCLKKNADAARTISFGPPAVAQRGRPGGSLRRISVDRERRRGSPGSHVFFNDGANLAGVVSAPPRTLRT